MKQFVTTIFALILLNSLAYADLHKLLEAEKQKYQAQGVAVVIIDSKNSGAFMVHQESSEKDTPQKLTSDYLFEPGNAMMPISFALLLDKDKVSLNTQLIYCKEDKGEKLDCKEINATDAIIYSSNKAMNTLSVHLRAEELYNGFKRFGFTHIPPLKKLKQKKIYIQVCARGYGMRTNLFELTNAYRVFSYPNNVIKEKTANKMRKLLIDAVEKGTGKYAKVKGMVVGGKTGTALMIDKRVKRYVHNYNSTFIGFADGNGHKYTIGVLVIDPKIGKLASKTATNVFKDVVISLLNDSFELGMQEYKKGNIKKAVKLIDKACNDGNSIACYNLALLYESGEKIKKDFDKVKKYYKKSCDNGFELACDIYNQVHN